MPTEILKPSRKMGRAEADRRMVAPPANRMVTADTVHDRHVTKERLKRVMTFNETAVFGEGVVPGHRRD